MSKSVLFFAVLLTITFFCFSVVIAQDETPEIPATVPNVVGLPVPTAVAQLNRIGLVVGAAQVVEWVESDTVEPNTVIEQTPPAGSEVVDGQIATITVSRPMILRVLYDDNDLTLINVSDGEINLTNIVLTAIDGNIPASFSASEWTVDTISPQRCVQIWSIGVQGAKNVEGCQAPRDIPWLYRSDASDHFWIDDNGATRFNLIQDGVLRGECNIAPNTSEVQQCMLYVASAGVGEVGQDVTEYVYFRYTNEQLWVINRSEDRWMPTSQVSIVDGLALDDATLFADTAPIGNLGLLAPHQCLLYTTSGDVPMLTPESCDLVGIAVVDESAVFWDSGFNINSRLMGATMICLPPQSDGETICLVPR